MRRKNFETNVYVIFFNKFKFRDKRSDKMSQDYGADHIKVLEGLEAVRKRPGMYIGSTSVNGLNHLIYEVIDNSVDEAMAGYCTDIDVIIDKDNIITIKDNGRGIPIDMHKEKNLPAVEVVLTTLHAGGKFEGEGYKVSGGLHGVGVSVVNALAEWLEVTVNRDGKNMFKSIFEESQKKPLEHFLKHSTVEETGTIIKFKPDASIFDTVEFGVTTIAHRLKELAYLNRGLTINFYNFRDFETEDEAKLTFGFEGGISSYVEDLNQNKEALFTPPIYLKKAVNYMKSKSLFNMYQIIMMNKLRRLQITLEQKKAVHIYLDLERHLHE